MGTHDFPAAAQQAMCSLFLDRFSPLYLLMDNSMRLQTWWGQSELYGYYDLERGEDCESRFEFLHGYDGSESLELPFLETTSGRVAEVHVGPAQDGISLIFLDAAVAHSRQQEIQQKAQELDLVQYRQAQLMKELRAARDELDIKRQQAEEASRQKSGFIAGMSHEFRTPLTSVLGYTQLLEKKLQHEPKLLEYVAALDRGAHHLLSLIENLLDQARIEAGVGIVRAAPTDLSRLLRDLESLFAPIATQRALQFVVHVGASLPERVEIDDLRLRQIFINLIGNACKFTTKGSVTVETDWLGGYLIARVVDTGPGIAPSDQKKIFTAFNRLDRSEQPGAGLGLAISKQLAELMGGSLELESERGAGSRFTLRLPASEAIEGARTPRDVSTTPERPEAQTLESEPKLSKQTVLLADDTTDIRELVRLFLDDIGYSLIMARDGREAINLALKMRPDLILMDVNMPVIDGHVATRTLRDAGFNRPIVALTAAASPQDRECLLQDGFDELALKPINRAYLIGLVERLLGVKSAV